MQGTHSFKKIRKFWLDYVYLPFT